MLRCRLAIIVCISAFLGACAPNLAYQGMDNPSMVGEQKLRLASAPVTIKITKADHGQGIVPTPQKLAPMIADYKKRGRGNFELLLPNNTQKISWLEQLQAAGLAASQLNIILSPDLPTTQMAVLRYEAWQVIPPADCTSANMPDADDFGFSTDAAYKLGCTRDQYLGAMVASPADLLGRDATMPADSQRLGAGQKIYREGGKLTPADTQPLTTGALQGGG
jgi:pilus biogenesis lipoprotein CpaD